MRQEKYLKQKKRSFTPTTNHRLVSGFTLIELLVVVMIVVVVAGLVITSLAPARRKSRDSKRVTNLDAIRGALETYKNEKGTYPSTGSSWVLSSNTCEASCDSSATVRSWFTDNANSLHNILKVYLSPLPQDPLQGKAYSDEAGTTETYAYYYGSNGSGYKLMARLEEGNELMINDGGVMPSTGVSSKMYEVYSLDASTWKPSDPPPPAISNGGNVIISEVYYDVAPDKGPSGSYGPGGNDGMEQSFEWIELYNPTSGSVDMDGWKISSLYGSVGNIAGLEKAAGRTTTIGSHEFAMIIPTTGVGFIAKWPGYPDAKIFVASAFFLNNNGDSLELKNPYDQVVDQLSWGTTATPLPHLADVAEGHSLARTSATSGFVDDASPNPGSF
ncbi:MAG: lamin tail domain-containing protein [Patescibacteria group bacterium]|jgi:prepilin-type N-terminal cleavage/methylation domain-containing protein